MKISNGSFGILIGVVTFLIGSAGITVCHYSENWMVWYGAMLIASFLIVIATALKDD